MKKPDGSVAELTESPSANLLWGAAADQDWAPGTYEVECKAGENAIAKATFEMAVNPPEVADGDIRVDAMRVFPVAGSLPPLLERKYANNLPADATTRIGIELEFSHAPLGRAAKVPVDCHFFWPDGQTSPPLVLSYEPQPALGRRLFGRGVGLGNARQLDQGRLHRQLRDQRAASRRRPLRHRMMRQDFPTTS